MKEKTFNDFWEELKAESPETREFCQKIDDEIEFCEMCAGRLKALIDRDKWIDVNDRLPENGENVLCWYEYFRYGEYNRMFKTYGIGYQYNGSWGGEVSNGTKTKVLAWRELPDPPRMEGEI